MRHTTRRIEHKRPTRGPLALPITWGLALSLVLFALVGCKSAMRAPMQEAKQAGPSPKKDKAPSGRKGKVEEADLYRITGTTMLYLHTYRGLAVIDLKDARKPKILTTLPVYGYPLEMFVERGVATILVRDAMELIRTKKGSSYRMLKRSQLITVDISTPGQPKILQRFDIHGKLREGVSRKIDHTLYVVSYQPKWYWRWHWRGPHHKHSQRKDEVTVYSFDISKPAKVRLIQSMPLVGSYVPPRHPRRKNEYHSLRGVTITGTANTLLVAERRHYSWSRRFFLLFRDYEYYSYTRLHIVDISDPKGKIRLHTRLRMQGDIEDQFKQTYRYNPKTKRALYLGIYKRSESKSQAAGWGRSRWLRKNTLWSIDVTDGDKPKVLDKLDFGKPNETVRGSLFDPQREVVFAITAIQRDPLYAISYKDPAKLKILSAVDGLSGDMNLFRFIEGRKFLLAVGRDFSPGCTGFEKDGRGSKVSVSIIDVQDLRKVRLVQRKCVKLKGALWASSQANFNRDQAHKMIGFFDDGKTRLLTVPVSYYERGSNDYDWWYRRRSAVGMMTWDLSHYNSSKAETNQQVLKNLGTFVHPAGQVRRTIIRELPQAGGTRRVLLNLSDSYLSLVDLAQPTKPRQLGLAEIASSTHQLYRFGQHRVELVNWSTGGYGAQYQRNVLRVRPWRPNAKGEHPILATIPLGRFRGITQWGDLLVVFRYPTKKVGKKGRIKYNYSQTELVVYDFKDPTRPIRRGALVFNKYLYFHNNYRSDFGGRQSFSRAHIFGYPSMSWIYTARGVGVIISEYRRSRWQEHSNSLYRMVLYDFDLRDPSKPKLQRSVLGDRGGRARILTLDREHFFLRYRQRHKAGWGRKRAAYTYEVVPFRLEKGRWKAGKSVETKEKLMAAQRHHGAVTFALLSADGSVLRFRRGATLASARLLPGKLPLRASLRNLVFGDPGQLYAITYAGKAHLHAVSWDGKAFQVREKVLTLSQQASLMSAHKEWVFLESQGFVLMYDLKKKDGALVSRKIRPFYYWSGSAKVHLIGDDEGAWFSGGPYGTLHIPYHGTAGAAKAPAARRAAAARPRPTSRPATSRPPAQPPKRPAPARSKAAPRPTSQPTARRP